MAGLAVFRQGEAPCLASHGASYMGLADPAVPSFAARGDSRLGPLGGGLA